MHVVAIWRPIFGQRALPPLTFHRTPSRHLVTMADYIDPDNTQIVNSQVPPRLEDPVAEVEKSSRDALLCQYTHMTHDECLLRVSY
jgi:hypothetical protein